MTSPNPFYNTSYTDYDDLEGNFTIAPTIEAFFDGDLLLHPFWMKYRPMIEGISPLVHYILGIFIGIVGFIGITGNVLVIYMFTVNKSLRTPSNLFIINLAISDLGFSAVNGFPLMTISCFMRKWYFGKIACELYAFLGGLFGFNSINSLAWISYDRMFVISKPFEAMRKSTMKRSSLQLLIVWGWALGWSVPPLFGWGAYIPEGFMTSCSFDYLTRDMNNQTYVWSMFAGGFVLPVLMIIYCYIVIIRAVTSQAKMMSKTAEKMGAKMSKDDKAKKQEIALAKVAAVTIIFFLLSWLPYAFVSLSAMAGFDAILTPYTCVIPVMFAKASAMWNPILYALSHPRFRAALDEMFPSLVLCRGLCMEKEADDGEGSDDGKKTGKKAKPGAPEESSVSEVSEISETSGFSSTGNDTNVKMNPNPERKTGGSGQPPSRPTQPPRSPQNGPGPLQPQEPRVAPGSGPGPANSEPANYQHANSGPRSQVRNRSFRSSIGRAAGEAYKNLIDAYVGLKNVTDKLADKKAQMTLEDFHPAASRRTSTVGFENPAYAPNVGIAGAAPPPQPPPPPPQHYPAYPPGVYSVPVVYQQAPHGQIIGYSAPGLVPAAHQAHEYYRSSSPVQFIQLPMGATLAPPQRDSPPSSATSVQTMSPCTTPPMANTPPNNIATPPPMTPSPPDPPKPSEAVIANSGTLETAASTLNAQAPAELPPPPTIEEPQTELPRASSAPPSTEVQKTSEDPPPSISTKEPPSVPTQASSAPPDNESPNKGSPPSKTSTQDQTPEPIDTPDKSEGDKIVKKVEFANKPIPVIVENPDEGEV